MATDSKSNVNQRELALVLIGSKGSGKSATGNTLCNGEKAFIKSPGTKVVATKIARKKISVDDTELTIIDTPCLTSAGELKKIYSQLQNVEKNNVIFAIVISIGRYTEEEKVILEEMFKAHGSILKNPIIIFTHESDLVTDTSSTTKEEWIKSCPTLASLINHYQIWNTCLENSNAASKEEKNKKANEIFHKLLNKTPMLQNININQQDTDKKIVLTKAMMVNEMGRMGEQIFDKVFAMQLPKQ